MGLVLGKLVHQLPGVTTLAYDIRLMRTIPHQKDLSKDYNFGIKNIKPWTHVAPMFPKKRRLGPQNSSESSGPEKLLKIVNCATIKKTQKLKDTVVGVQVGQVGGHQHPPRSFLPPQEAMVPLGSNVLHCVEFLHEMRKLLLNMVLGELFYNL